LRADRLDAEQLDGLLARVPARPLRDTGPTDHQVQRLTGKAGIV
jgi:hypothetical protein